MSTVREIPEELKDLGNRIDEWSKAAERHSDYWDKMEAAARSRRRYEIAKAALAGMLAYSMDTGNGDCHNNGSPESVATAAVEYADALIAELDKPRTTTPTPA